MRARVALALFPWGVMAVEACGVLACLVQYTTVRVVCVLVCSAIAPLLFSLMSTGGRRTSREGQASREQGWVGTHAGGGKLQLEAPQLLVITVNVKSLSPHWPTSALHGYIPNTSWYKFSVGGVTTERWTKVPRVPN